MKVAYVTGGTKGIGLAIVQSLLKDKYRVAFSGRSENSISEAMQTLDGYEDYLLPIVSNVKSYDDEQRAVEFIKDKWNQLDLVVANAGIGHFAPIDELTLDQWNETIDVNLTGVFHTVKSTLELIKQSKGYYMTIASLAGTNFFARGTAYNASKFGLVGFTQAMMLDLRDFGIKTTTIMPGSVSTHFNGRTPGDGDAWKIQPEDIAQIVIDLLHMDSRTLPSKIEVRPSFPRKP